MAVAAKTLGVDLVDVLGAGRTGGKPSALRDDLDAADRRIVARGLREHALDRLAGHFRDPDLLRRQARQFLLLLGRRWCFDPVGRPFAELAREAALEPAGAPAGPRRHL